MGLNLATSGITVRQPAYKVANHPGLKQNQQVSFTSDGEKDELVVKQPKGEQLSVLPNLGRGFIQPIKDIFKALIEAPLPSAIILGATAAAMRFSKLFGSMLTIGICTYGAFKIGSGTINASKAIRAEKKKDLEERDYAKANAEVREIGEGMFDVALTAKTAADSAVSLYNTGKAIAAAKSATVAQKVYALIKQTEQPAIIMAGPKQLPDVWTAFKADGMKEIIKLKNMLTGSRSSEIPEAMQKMGDMIGKANPQKAEVVEGLQDIAKLFKTDSKTAKGINSILNQLRTENVSKLAPEQITQIQNLLSGVESLEEIPAGMRVLRGAMKSGVDKLDDVSRVITKQVKNVRTGAETAIPTTSMVGDDR